MRHFWSKAPRINKHYKIIPSPFSPGGHRSAVVAAHVGRRGGGNPLIWKYKLLNLRRVTILWMDKKGRWTMVATRRKSDPLYAHTHTYTARISQFYCFSTVVSIPFCSLIPVRNIPQKVLFTQATYTRKHFIPPFRSLSRQLDLYTIRPV